MSKDRIQNTINLLCEAISEVGYAKGYFTTDSEKTIKASLEEVLASCGEAIEVLEKVRDTSL